MIGLPVLFIVYQPLAVRTIAYGTYKPKEEGSVLGGLGNLFDGRE